MPRSAKAAVTAVAIVCTIALGAGAATANRSLGLSSPGAIRLSSSAVTFRAGLLMVCGVTLAGSLSRSIPKLELTTAGSVTSGTWSRCVGNAAEGELFWTGVADIAELRLGLPWTVRYKAFLGLLPNISGIRLQVVEAAFLWSLGTTLGTIRCLWRGTIELQGEVSRGSLSAFRVVLPNALPLIADLSRTLGAPCPATLELLAGFTLSPTQTVTLL